MHSQRNTRRARLDLWAEALQEAQQRNRQAKARLKRLEGPVKRRIERIGQPQRTPNKE